MSALKKHLRVAIRHLKLEHTELDQALDHAICAGYDGPWIDAIEKAVKTNLETTTHVQNILATIEHPSCGRGNHKPRMVRPPRG